MQKKEYANNQVTFLFLFFFPVFFFFNLKINRAPSLACDRLNVVWVDNCYHLRAV